MLSYTMLTIDATHHPLMQQYHGVEDEKRMVVILPEDAYGAWLDAPSTEAMEWLKPYKAENLVALGMPKPGNGQLGLF